MAQMLCTVMTDVPSSAAAPAAFLRDAVVPKRFRRFGPAQRVNETALCAGNVPASRDDEALGCQKIGTYRIALLQTLTVIGETA